MSIEIAKPQAVQLGVKCALEKCVANVVVEVDSQIMSFALMKQEVNLSYFIGIVADILEACKDFESVCFSWVRRPGNLVSHCLSHYAFHCNSLYLLSSIPEKIVNIFYANSLTMD